MNPRTLRWTFGLLLSLATSLPALCPAGEKLGDTGIEATIEQVEPLPLPMQAVAFRFSWRNHRDQPIAPQPGMQSSFEMRAIRGTGDASPQPLKGDLVGDGIVCGDYAPRDLISPEIHPGHELSVVDAWSMQFLLDGKPVQALVPTAGDYEFHFSWHLRGKRFESSPVKVKVREPKGDDLEVLKLLQQDADFGLMMMSYKGIPGSSRQVEQLQEIVSRYPESSYADYARFALIRNVDFTIRHTKSPNRDQGVLDSRSRILPWVDGCRLESFAYAPRMLLIARRSIGGDQRTRLSARLDDGFPLWEVRLEDLSKRLTEDEWRSRNPWKALLPASSQK
jgi:hypothetical protein